LGFVDESFTLLGHPCQTPSLLFNMEGEKNRLSPGEIQEI
jgi:hypothetical protein